MKVLALVWNISLTIFDFIYAISMYSAGRFKWACVMSFCTGLMLMVTLRFIVDKFLKD